MATETDSTSPPARRPAASACHRPPGPCHHGQMRIVSVESTDLFTGTPQRPLQVIRVTLVNEGPAMLATPAMSATIGVQGAGVRDPGPFGLTDVNAGEEKALEVPGDIAPPYQPGSTRRITATVTSDAGRTQAVADVTVAEPGWTMWMVSPFH